MVTYLLATANRRAFRYIPSYCFGVQTLGVNASWHHIFLHHTENMEQEKRIESHTNKKNVYAYIMPNPTCARHRMSGRVLLHHLITLVWCVFFNPNAVNSVRPFVDHVSILNPFFVCILTPPIFVNSLLKSLRFKSTPECSNKNIFHTSK